MISLFYSLFRNNTAYSLIIKDLTGCDFKKIVSFIVFSLSQKDVTYFRTASRFSQLPSTSVPGSG